MSYHELYTMAHIRIHPLLEAMNVTDLIQVDNYSDLIQDSV